jgi:hypothetical protein
LVVPLVLVPPARFPCPPNTPIGMYDYCDNPQPLPPPFAPSAPRGPATAGGQPPVCAGSTWC